MKNITMWILTWVVLIGLGSIIVIDKVTAPKTGYVIIQQLYEQFEMKKELEQKYILTASVRQKIIDSLAFDLKMLTKKIESEKEKNKEDEILFSKKREEFYFKNQNFTKENAQLSKEYDGQILTQLNQYVSDYGREYKFKYIFGNDGDGSLMYGEDAVNITGEVVTYINQKYRGVK